MRVVSDTITDEYDCLYDSVTTNPKKLVKEITNIENKLKCSSKHVTNFRERGQTGPPIEAQTPKDKGRKSKDSGPEMAAPIPRKAAKPPRDAGMCCAFFDKYNKVVKSHTTTHCKR